MAQTQSIDTVAFAAALAERMGPDTALALHDFTEFPLARHVALPEGMPFDLGHVGMAFDGLALHMDAAPKVTEAEGPALAIAFDRMKLAGTYRLASKKAMKPDMDTGGTLLDFPNGSPAAGTDPAGQPPLDPAKNAEMLEQARAQRVKLRETPNGQALVEMFSTHNEAFNTIFVKNATLRQLWRAGGATQAMALDTSDALKRDTTVNGTDAKYKTGSGYVTYNQNAFLQQLNVAMAAISETGDPTDPGFEPDPESPFTKAALAALSFGNAVGQSGNDETKITPLTPSEIHDHVQNGTEPPPADLEQLRNALAQSQSQDGGAAATLARERNWRVLDEDDRAHVRRVIHEMAREKFERQNAHPIPLWSGACSAILDGVTARLSWDHDGTPRAEVTLPAFLVDLDDSGWTGAAAETLRARLRDMYFVRRMLQEGIRAGLRQSLEACAGALPGTGNRQMAPDVGHL